ncbi:MAG: tripartite tricarboxylate transporter permease, partial [Candidatus Woesearchaeota archaeon]
LVKLKDPLFPLLSGLFGTSMLLLSIKDNTKIPEQKTAGIEFEKKKGVKATLCSVVAGWFCSFMPGLGPSEAAILGSTFFKDLGNKGFLILTGGLGTVNMALSLVTFYTLNKARNGAIVTVSEIITNVDYNTFLIFWGVSLTVGGIATVLASKLSKIFAKLMCRINYKILCISIVCLVTFLVIIISGWLGLLVLAISTLFGMIPALKNVGRNHMMGCLLVPVMIYFLL